MLVILTFNGYFDESQIERIPTDPGIYAAFACEMRNGRVSDAELLYIGKGEGNEGMRGRVKAHIDGNENEAVNGRQSTWERDYRQTGRVIKYAYARQARNLHDIEAALVYHNQPPYNGLLKNNYCGYINGIAVLCAGNTGNMKRVTTICRRQIVSLR